MTGNIRADDTVPHFTSVEELANSNTERLLVGGTKKINGLQINDRSSVQVKHEQRSFCPGDILSIEKVYFGETRKRTRLFRKPKYITEKFLMCRDEADREVLLPFEQTGIFYQISHKNGKATKNVLQMSDIVARKLTPRIIKLVYGRFPVTSRSFTGLMRAESSKIETSIIASTIINTKNILLEIPVTSAMYFRVAIMDDALRKNPCYRGAMGMCAERAMTYMRNIKVCYNFTTDDGAEGSPIHPTLVQQQSLPPKFSQEGIEFDDSPQSRRHNIIMKTFSDNEEYLNKRHTSIDDDKNDVNIRPGRCISTGRMSFCLSNRYLTVPVLEPTFNKNRNSGNNNTFQGEVYTTRRGSRISFNGKFFEEEQSGAEADVSSDLSLSNIPPPLACTNIGSYVNVVPVPNIQLNGDSRDYIPTSSGSRRPSTQPPTVSPPPLPESSSTSGVSSGSTSSVSDGTISNRGSTESFEYAVPKIDEHQTVLTNIRERSKSSGESQSTFDNSSKPRVRRPSTFTFSEGCFLNSPSVSKVPTCKVIHEPKNDENTPIYENIKSLLELVTELETHNEDCEDTNENTVVPDQEEEETDEDREGHAGNINATSDINSFGDNIDDLGKDGETGDSGFSLPEVEEGQHETEEKEEVDRDFEQASSFQCNSDRVNDIADLEHKAGTDSSQDPSGYQGFETEVDVDRDFVSATCERGSLGKTNEGTNKSDNANSEEAVNGTDKQLDIDECIALNNGVADNCVNGDDFQNVGVEILNAENVTHGDINESKDTDQFTAEVKDLNTENEIDQSSNVRPSDSSNRWRKAVRNMLNVDVDFDTKVINYSSRHNVEPSEKPLEMYSCDDIAVQLRAIGIKETSVQQLQILKIDGSTFRQILEGEVSIRDCLNGVNLIDQQKISMFIRGWRPTTE